MHLQIQFIAVEYNRIKETLFQVVCTTDNISRGLVYDHSAVYTVKNMYKGWHKRETPIWLREA